MTTPSSTHAILVDRTAPGGLALREVATPVPYTDEAIIRVAAVSLDLDEVDQALRSAPHSARLGRDLAGVVEYGADHVTVGALVAAGARLHGVALAEALRRAPAAGGLERLAALVGSRTLVPHVEVEVPWTEVASVVEQLRRQEHLGRAVLHL